MDLIETGFRPKYEAIAVGNKPVGAQNVFFEGLLLQEGLGMLLHLSITEYITEICNWALLMTYSPRP